MMPFYQRNLQLTERNLFDFLSMSLFFKQVDLDYYEIEDPIAKVVGNFGFRTILEPERVKLMVC